MAPSPVRLSLPTALLGLIALACLSSARAVSKSARAVSKCSTDPNAKQSWLCLPWLRRQKSAALGIPKSQSNDDMRGAASVIIDNDKTPALGIPAGQTRGPDMPGAASIVIDGDQATPQIPPVVTPPRAKSAVTPGASRAASPAPKAPPARASITPGASRVPTEPLVVIQPVSTKRPAMQTTPNGEPPRSFEGSKRPTESAIPDSFPASPSASVAASGEVNAAAETAAGGGSTCFPGSATVLREDGERVRMDVLKVGDRVEIARGKFSPVFMFTHRAAGVKSSMIRLSTNGGATLTLSPGHYLYVGHQAMPARNAAAGAYVEFAGKQEGIAAVEKVQAEGLYNPHTLHGDIIVDGFHVSSYTDACPPDAAQAALAPFRALRAATGMSVEAFDNGVPGAEEARARLSALLTAQK